MGNQSLRRSEAGGEAEEECYICGRHTRESEGEWQIGRAPLRFSQLMIKPRFCCHSCAKRGRRIFAFFLIIFAVIVVALFLFLEGYVEI